MTCVKIILLMKYDLSSWVIESSIILVNARSMLCGARNKWGAIHEQHWDVPNVD